MHCSDNNRDKYTLELKQIAKGCVSEACMDEVPIIQNIDKQYHEATMHAMMGHSLTRIMQRASHR